jgi:hypothetical protein
MTMPVEKIRNSSDTLVFSEAAAALIFAELKLATTKLMELDPVDCAPGDVLIAECGEENRFPVTIIDVTDLKLAELSLPRLSLGSFISHDEAMDKLGAFFQKDVGPDTLVRHYVFIPQEKFDLLPEDVQTLLIENSIEDLMKMQQLRGLFYPSMVHWLAEKLDYNVGEWIDFLRLFSLIEATAIDDLSALLDSNTQLVDVADDKKESLYE